jgi:hypothetical protein
MSRISMEERMLDAFCGFAPISPSEPQLHLSSTALIATGLATSSAA